jgi:xanthine dehydrogenase large subunit
LRQAAAAFGPAGRGVDLGSPATPERVYWALHRARRALREPDAALAAGVAGP